jgi:hypothetical protein
MKDLEKAHHCQRCGEIPREFCEYVVESPFFDPLIFCPDCYHALRYKGYIVGDSEDTYLKVKISFS